MPCKVCCLEPNDIGAQHPPQQILPKGQTSKDLRARKGDVDEEPDGGRSWNLGGQAKERGEKEKVVVVHPNDVAFLVVRDNRVGKPLVDSNVLFVGC